MNGISASELQQHVIRPTLQAISLWSDAAEYLLLGTAAQESQLGYYLTQIHGPALGIYQIEPATHADVWQNYLEYQPYLAEKVQTLLSPFNTQDKDQALITNLAYSTAIARIIYYRVPQPLPAAYDLPGLAAYWKQYYNTPAGQGTVEEFMANYKEMLL
jgi:hypothetical protein